ncbi:hypothetical protein Tco_0922111 [Tanacetum coccineum]|uniref:Reverse transcriptase domain-containing protein n=1 Tax=Tanacetum coccineum TaxID=301880 RepID=A0ABQ5CYQ3_9ASTR
MHYLIVFKVFCSGRPPDTAYPPVGYDVSNLLLKQRINCCSLTSVLPNNTAYSVHSIRRTNIQQINTAYSNKLNMAYRSPNIVAVAILRTMTKPASENDLHGSDNTTRELNKNAKFKIGDEFVKILHDNAKILQDNTFNEVNKGDVIDHMAKVLEISEWIKIPNIDRNQIRWHVFLISLSGRAREWWDNETKGTVTTWKELGEKFFR